MDHHPFERSRVRRPLLTRLSLLLCGTALAVFGATGVASASPLTQAAPVSAASTGVAPNGNSGTTISPLQYNCSANSATCGQVGETYGWYNGTTTRFLYSNNYFCGTPAGGYKAQSTSGCEAGHASAQPPPSNTTNGDVLYIPVPLYKGAPNTQCNGKATCIDHSGNIDLSPLASTLDPILGTTPAQLANTMIPGHDHVITTRNNGNPEWWPVEVVGVATPAAMNIIQSGKSLAAINAAIATKGAVGPIPTNESLFFQVLPGTVPPAQAAAAAAANYPAYSPPASLFAHGTFNNLKSECGAGGANCSGVGITHDWLNGTDVQALYTQNYFCDTSVASGAASKCEAGAKANKLPPGATASQIDPLYIPVPVGFTPTYAQCAASYPCIDHPTSIDLTRLASVLNPVLHTTTAQLANTMLPGHDHIITTRNLLNGNNNSPEWWDVVVVPVTSQAALNQIQNAKSYTALKAMETSNFSSGVGPEIPTNSFLWFQTLPGTSAPTPGPLASSCSSTLPSGSVVGMASLPGGTGYVEVNSAGNVAVKGGAACYGSLSGVSLNQPIVGVAVDRATGGYWLVAKDGGVFAFNAPYMGGEGGTVLNKPIVGMAATRNGNGYDLVASDGGVFTFGSAKFAGSTGAMALNKPVVGMSLDRKTGGYWLVASDGGVFSFNAPFRGSTGGVTLNKPVVAMASTSNGSGYHLIASDGGVFSFNAPYYGSTGNLTLAQPVVGAANNNSGDGYWMVAADGGIFSFNTLFYGSAA